MGGWCGQRDKCANYVRPAAWMTPAERLCGKTEQPEPIKPESAKT
jgi:hypothetical protein